MPSPPRSRPAGAVTARAPASISNLGCGFDVLGIALEGPEDRVTVRRADGEGIRVNAVRWASGTGPDLPRDETGNTAAAAARALLTAAEARAGLDLEIDKGLPLGSGLGGSAASAVAAVVAVNELLGLGASRQALLAAALAGEAASTGDHPGDNVAAELLGGVVLARSVELPEAISLPVPAELRVAVALPAVEVNTRRSRGALPAAVPLPDAVRQWANVGALVAALYEEDWDLLSRCLEDHVAEPSRGPTIPGYFDLKQAAVEAGALGANLSGSGPAVFALCRGDRTAERVVGAWTSALDRLGLGGKAWASRANAPGSRVVTGEV